MDAVKETLREGEIINDRYKLLTLKGTGSFGQVWKAADTVTGEEVALKVYIPLDVNGREMFKREYLLTKRFRHRNLLSADHFDNWGARPFLIMQYCERGSAAGLIGKADEALLWQFINDVAGGLEFLHAMKIVHQDIKPDNILIDEYGNFLITDFGISKQLKATMRAQSTTMSGAGSVSYMGPERFASAPQTLPASDVWSLGAALYHLACSVPPFNGMGGGLQRHGADMPELPPKFSRHLNSVMQSCLALNPVERPTAAMLAKMQPKAAVPVPPPFIPKTADQTMLDAGIGSAVPTPPVPNVGSGENQAPLPPPPPYIPKKHTFLDDMIRGFKDGFKGP